MKILFIIVTQFYNFRTHETSKSFEIFDSSMAAITSNTNTDRSTIIQSRKYLTVQVLEESALKQAEGK